MIKLNLYPGKKPTNLTKIAGFDILKLNKIGILVAILYWMVPEGFLLEHYQEKEAKISAVHKVLNKEISQIKKDVNASKEFESEVKKLKNQEQALSETLRIIKDIFKARRNPFGLLLYVAKNIPEGLWITSMTLENDQLVLIGASYAYKNIGKFIENLQSSIYLKGEPKYVQSRDGINDLPKGVKAEGFQITAVIGKLE